MSVVDAGVRQRQSATTFGGLAQRIRFGGPYSSSSTDIGTAVIYAVVFMGLLTLDYETSPSRFNVDSLIEQHVSWWHRIAEITPRGKHEKPATTTPAPVTPAPLATAGR
jgi:hypothetical protein